MPGKRRKSATEVKPAMRRGNVSFRSDGILQSLLVSPRLLHWIHRSKHARQLSSPVSLVGDIEAGGTSDFLALTLRLSSA